MPLDSNYTSESNASVSSIHEGDQIFVIGDYQLALSIHSASTAADDDDIKEGSQDDLNLEEGVSFESEQFFD